YLHALYQVMSLAFADRDFYYGDPYFPPEEPRKGLLSKEYAKERVKLIDWTKNDPGIKPGDPYAFEGKQNPFAELLKKWQAVPPKKAPAVPQEATGQMTFEEAFTAGTT